MTPTSQDTAGMFHDEPDMGNVLAFSLYVVFMLAVYWPVFLGQRFFWEDFFILDIPVRDYSYYMFAVKHTLPFWNPYNWGWAAFLADPQTGFWYPTNLIQILIATVLGTGSGHPSVLLPEAMTLLHLPLAALGTFSLLKKEFKINSLAAFLAGITFGFGLMMIGEQNHPAKIYQLALLPWEMLLLMRGWKKLKYLFAFGLISGIAFLAGQPQIYFLCMFFLLCFTLAECIIRWRSNANRKTILYPLISLSFGVILSVCVAAIQLFPSFELARLSPRSGMSYDESAYGALDLGKFPNFFVPKFLGENPGFGTTLSDTVHVSSWYWYWEAAVYWGTLAEILALFAIVALWHRRNSDDPKSRYLVFAVVFFFFSLAFGLGENLHFQWIFWKFVPMFNNFRAPNRMIWLACFLGALFTGIGFDLIYRNPQFVFRRKKLLLSSGATFIIFNLLTIIGVFDRIFATHHVRSGLWRIIGPGLIISIVAFVYLYAVIRNRIARRWILPFAILLIASDLFFWDFTWFDNKVNREQLIAADSKLPAITTFFGRHRSDHAKLLWLHISDSSWSYHAGIGTILREPIEEIQDSEAWKEFNPTRPQNPFPLINDTTKRMEIMGIAERYRDTGAVEQLSPLPFLRIYHNWIVTKNNKEQAQAYSAPGFDFHETILLEQAPSFFGNTNAAAIIDTAYITDFRENRISIEADCSRPGVLVVNDLYYPAWKASADGKETTIVRAFTNLRGIALPAGQHHIELRYDSRAFNAGWRISVAAILFAFGGLLVTRKKQDPAEARSRSKVR